jgi:hypothetical protein
MYFAISRGKFACADQILGGVSIGFRKFLSQLFVCDDSREFREN